MDTNKVYSVIALLDDDSTQTFLSLRRKLSVIEGNYNNTLPHITISVYDKGIDLDGLIQWTQQIAENHYKFKVIYTTVGIFLSNCLIAVPSFSKRLYMLYENHHQRYDECCRNYSALKNDEWFPHTGILYTNKKTARENIGKLVDMFKIIEAEIVSLRITEFDYNVFNKIAEFTLQEPSRFSHGNQFVPNNSNLLGKMIKGTYGEIQLLPDFNELLNDIQRNGLSSGIGKPEPLKHRKAWSGRINFIVCEHSKSK